MCTVMVVIIIYHDIGTFLCTKGGREVTLKKIIVDFSPHCNALKLYLTTKWNYETLLLSTNPKDRYSYHVGIVGISNSSKYLDQFLFAESKVPIFGKINKAKTFRIFRAGIVVTSILSEFPVQLCALYVNLYFIIFFLVKLQILHFFFQKRFPLFSNYACGLNLILISKGTLCFSKFGHYVNTMSDLD